MSTPNRDLTMEVSLVSIGESGKKKVSAENTGESLDNDEDGDSIAAEDRLCSDTKDEDASNSPKKAPDRRKVIASDRRKISRKRKEKKRQENDKIKNKFGETSGDEVDCKTQSQTTVVLPSKKIPSLGGRSSSTEIPTKNGKAGKEIKRKSEKVRSQFNYVRKVPSVPTPFATTSPTATGRNKGHGRPTPRRVQRIMSFPALGFASAKSEANSPDADKSDSAATSSKRRPSSARAYSLDDSPRRMEAQFKILREKLRDSSLSPPLATTSPTATSRNKGHGRPTPRRVQRIMSFPALGFASAKSEANSPDADKSDSAATSSKRRPSSARACSLVDSPRRMDLKELQERFGTQQEYVCSKSPLAVAAADYVEIPTELRAYGLPIVNRAKGPGLKNKEYRMSPRSLRYLEPESSGTDDDGDDNLIAYLKNSNYKLDL